MVSLHHLLLPLVSEALSLSLIAANIYHQPVFLSGLGFSLSLVNLVTLPGCPYIILALTHILDASESLCPLSGPLKQAVQSNFYCGVSPPLAIWPWGKSSASKNQPFLRFPSRA